MLYRLPAELSQELRDVLITTHHVPEIEDDEKAVSNPISWQSIDLHPTAYPVLTNLAFVHLSTYRPVSAESFARQAVQADPLSPKALYLLGIALAGQNKNKAEAIRLLEKTCGTYGRAHFSIAPLLTEADRLPEAAQHLRAYLALDLPTNRDLARQWLKNLEQELKRRP